MALANWSDKYSVNIEKIDTQHKKLFDYINQIHDATINKKTKDELGKIINSLVDYTVDHFKTEEKLFSTYQYPDEAVHKVEHQVFVEKVAEFKKDFESGKILLSLKIVNFLKDWLINHILGTDKQYSEFLNAKGVK